MLLPIKKAGENLNGGEGGGKTTLLSSDRGGMTLDLLKSI